MAITIDDFSKIWASTSPLTPYEFSESNYKEGWNFIGGTPPSRQMWDFLQKQNDEKLKYLLDNFNDYLSLAGGTMTGEITAQQQFVKRDVDDDYLALSGGSDGDSGAVLGLSGKDRTGGFSGQFSLYAKDGVNSKALYGKPDGTLTWDGKAIIVGTEATETFTNISINGNNGYNSVTLQHAAKYCTMSINGSNSQKVIPHLLNDFKSVYLVNLNATNVTVDLIVNYIY